MATNDPAAHSAGSDAGPDAGSGVRVRRVRPEEWPALRAIRLRALADAPDAFGATLADEAMDPDATWQQRASDRVSFVAELAGRFVGVAGVGPAPVEAPVAMLYAMWVEPEVRGTGVATAIVEAAVDWARDAGYPGLGLGVTTTNARAIAFYERLGFVDTGQRYPLRQGSRLDIQIMVRTFA